MKVDDDYFLKIGEISKKFNIEPHVLRYWEKEFKTLKPKKTSAGQRIYNKNSIDLVARIKELLHDKKYTIDGARKLIEAGDLPMKVEQKSLFDIQNNTAFPEALNTIKSELTDILTILNREK